jgi:hypothetical protein
VDVLLRLRVLIWVLILGLWGVMVYQFLGEEEQERAQVAQLDNPFKGRPLPLPVPEPPPSVTPPARPPADGVPPPPEQPAAQTPPASAGPSSLDYIKPLPLQTPMPARPRARAQAHSRRERGPMHRDPAVPPGFLKRSTRHFLIYSEGDPCSDQFIALLENLHGNLMLDLAAFSPWASDEKVSIFLFKSQEAYRSVTGRPAWSGGASSVPTRKVFVYESEELPGILAHELTHIYYDGFYIAGQPDPLWLSEGMATLVQVERGLAAPAWLKENLEMLERGGGFTMQQMMAVTSTADSSDEKVRLWYAQAYSTVRFLIRSQSKGSFYRFSQYIREGKDTTQALYRAYGMPYNRIKALEYAWRYELASNSLSRLSRDR